MNRIRSFIAGILTFLRIRRPAAGLEVSDQVVRLVYARRKVWQLSAVRLAPGVIESGRIKDRKAFIEALGQLKEKVLGRSRRKRIDVVLCPSSIPAFTQVFSLPGGQGKEFSEAVTLNMAMASPMEAGKAYEDWQAIGRDERTFQTEIFSAFMERAAVDEMVDALFDAGFVTVSVESRELALARVLRAKAAGVDPAKSYVFVSVDNIGIDFLIIRHGNLYFNYSEPWRDIADEKGEIPLPKLAETLTASVRRVVAFYRERSSDPIAAVILASAALDEESAVAIASAVSAPVVRLTLVVGQAISPEWLAAVGSSLRETETAVRGREINFMGEASQDRFLSTQFSEFLEFWRVAIPVALGLLVGTFLLTDLFLISTKQSIEVRSNFNVGGPQSAEIKALTASSTQFNQMVALVQSVEGSLGSPGPMFAEVTRIAQANQVTVDRIDFASGGAPIVLAGVASAENDIIAFKAAVAGSPDFSSVSLPLTSLRTTGNTFSFSMSFYYTPSSTAVVNPDK